MTGQEDTRKKSRRDLLLVLLILPLGILCMFMTGQAAIRLAPKWMLPADMLSLLDPDADFAGGKPFSIPPLNPNILTLPAWGDVFLTPNIDIPTRVILPTATPPPVRTQRPPVVKTPEENPEPTATSGSPIIQPTFPYRLAADLEIEKSDNSRTYTPGTSIHYTILVTNRGPNPALIFDVIDNLPTVIEVVSVNCTPATFCGTNASNGNKVSFTGAHLPFNTTAIDRITITVNGMVASSATGKLANTAEVVIPSHSKYNDPDLSNNTVTDTDTQLSVYDLAITKSDGSDVYTAVDPIDYTVVVTNSGPSDALRIRVRDPIPGGITSWTWVCTAVVRAGGCNGVTNSTSVFTDTVNIQVGGRIEYSVRALPALPPQNPGNLSNTARVILPSGSKYVDPDLSNNTARDVDRPLIDLQITKDDGLVTYTPGGNLTYTVTVTNASSFNLSNVSVTDMMPSMISAWTWSCVPGLGASCTPGPATTNINDTAVRLPPGGSATYTINATVQAAAAGTLDNTAVVAPPTGLVDATPGDNTATDSDTSAAASEPNIGPPNLIYPPWNEGDPPIIRVFGPPIVANGDAAPDLVYYEFEDPANPGSIALDWVQIDISTDGANWITVFNWGDGNQDTNTNAPYNLCPAEDDNCLIPFGRLYNQTGITINVDPRVPAGSYSWIRISAPAPSPGGDAPEVDSIQPYYP